MARTLEAYAPNSLSAFTVKVVVAGAVTETITMSHVAAEPGTWRGTIAAVGSVGEAKLSYYWNGSTTEADVMFANISATDGTTAYARGPSYSDISTLAANLGTIDDLLDNEIATIITLITAVKNQTDNLPSDPADQSLIIAQIDATLVKIRKYLQIITRRDASIAIDNAVEVAELNADGGSGVGGFNNTTESLEAVADLTNVPTVILSRPAVIPATDLIAGTLLVRRGDTFQQQLTGLGDLSDMVEMWWTAKAATSDSDEAAKVQVTLTGGLIRIVGGEAETAENGSITIDEEDDDDDSVTLALDEVETAKLGDDSSTQLVSNTLRLPVVRYLFDIQGRTSAGVTRTVAEGVMKVSSDVTISTE